MKERRRTYVGTDEHEHTVGFVVLTFAFHKEGHLWVGECKELGTATDGRSLEKVERELTKLVELHLNGLEDIGECDRLLAERGIKFYTDHPPTEVTLKMQVATDGGAMIQVKSIPVGSALAGAHA